MRLAFLVVQIVAFLIASTLMVLDVKTTHLRRFSAGAVQRCVWLSLGVMWVACGGVLLS